MNKSKMEAPPVLSLIMGSQSDWETMQHAHEILNRFAIPHEVKIISAHRTPHRLYEFAGKAKARGIKIIIAGAGGAAHLPGMVASLTPLPVLGVPVESKSLKGLDSLYSIVQMPAGIPVATFAIGKAGAVNAALTAISILALTQEGLAKSYQSWRDEQSNSIANSPLPVQGSE